MALESALIWLFVAMCLVQVGRGLSYLWRKVTFGPDPWDAGITEQLEDPRSVPVCHHCFTPQEHGRWFCSECGRAVGPYNNVMPFISVFSYGEVARNAVYNHVLPSPLTIFGYLCFGLSEYLVDAEKALQCSFRVKLGELRRDSKRRNPSNQSRQKKARRSFRRLNPQALSTALS
jgi:hypothetical protein